MVGQLTGGDVAVAGALEFSSVGGNTIATIGNGNEVTVNSGQARIELVEGGEITVCGPAHFTIFKSGNAITLALDYGRVHPMLDASVPFTVFTPFVIASPVSIDQGRRDLTISLERTGALCAIPVRGAARIEQQLSGQSVLLPEGGATNWMGGQLSATPPTPQSCGCGATVSKNEEPKPLELSVPVKPPVQNPAAVPPPVVSDQPVYMVYMPPLTFDANSPEPPPDPDPQTILLVRESRLRPDVVFRGRVEPKGRHGVSPPSKDPNVSAGARKDSKANSTGAGLFARIFGIFRHRKDHTAA